MPCIANLPRVGQHGYIVQGFINGQPMSTPESWLRAEARVTSVRPFDGEGMQIVVALTLTNGVQTNAEIHRSEWSTDTPLPEPE